MIQYPAMGGLTQQQIDDLAVRAERTYLICAHCNGVNEVSNDTPTEVVVVWKYQEGLGVTFNCQHCAAIYPLILKRPKKGRELELMIERGEKMQPYEPQESQA